MMTEPDFRAPDGVAEPATEAQPLSGAEWRAVQRIAHVWISVETLYPWARALMVAAAAGAALGYYVLSDLHLWRHA